jgi:hypothetical protein
MAPIYDTDIAQSRWDRADWENYELWEKVAHRHRRQRRGWIAATVVVFLSLSSIPIVLDRWDKWSTLAASRRLAEEINRIKRDAGIEQAAYRLRFAGDGKPEYHVEKSRSCSDAQSSVVRSGKLFEGDAFSQYVLMTPAMGAEAGIPGLIQDFCYDYLAGSDTILRGEGVAGFAIMPVKDLAEKRQDRLSILLVNGPSAMPAFD